MSPAQQDALCRLYHGEQPVNRRGHVGRDRALAARGWVVAASAWWCLAITDAGRVVIEAAYAPLPVPRDAGGGR